MISLKLQDGDLVLNEFEELELIEGPEEVAQSFKLRVETNLREWFLDESLGFDYSELHKKSYDKELIRFALIECLSQDERYEELISFDLKVVDRKAILNFKALINGIEIELEVTT